MATKLKRRKRKAPQNERARKTALQISADAGDTLPESRVRPVVGSLVSTGDLIVQGTRLVEAARHREAALAAANWPKERTEALALLVTRFKVTSTLRKAEVKRSTAAYLATVSRGRAFRKRLAAKLRVAALARPEVLETTPLPRGRMTNATKLMQWLNDVHAPMDALRTELAHESPNVDWFARLKEETLALAGAMGAQEVRRSQRSARADERIAEKNALVSSMEELRTRARDVFVDSPLVLKTFTKWSGLKRKRAKSIQAADAGPGTRGASSLQTGEAPAPQSGASTGAQPGAADSDAAGSPSSPTPKHISHDFPAVSVSTK